MKEALPGVLLSRTTGLGPSTRALWLAWGPWRQEMVKSWGESGCGLGGVGPTTSSILPVPADAMTGGFLECILGN